MAVRPKRTNPLSTRPVYLTRVPAKELQEAKAQTGEAGIRIFVDGPVAVDVAAIVDGLSRQAGLLVSHLGNPVSALAGRPHTEVRQAVATLGNRLAWARIYDEASRAYRRLPLRAEVDAEEALFLGRSQPAYEGVSHPSPAAGPLYDAAEAQAALGELIAAGSAGAGTDVVVTARWLAQWDETSGRWLPVTVAPGAPIILSTATAAAAGEKALLAELVNAIA